MTPIAIAFLALSLIIVWGGLVASMVFLAKGDVDPYPLGGDAFDDSPDA